ncbi:MAG: preprotein translocase subunit YajC [Ruminococcaceae bacterium]|nr:preprotein translocase subunit YajC [Oscillospiraceae bacterium]
MTSGLSSILLMVAMVGIFYFLLIRPQKKREKKTQEMRSSIEVGDGITTVGGIVGRVVSIKDETLLIETGSDRSKLRIQRWAVQDVEKLNIEEEKTTGK